MDLSLNQHATEWLLPKCHQINKAYYFCVHYSGLGFHYLFGLTRKIGSTYNEPVYHCPLERMDS